MNARQLKAAHIKSITPVATLLLEIEMPNTSSFEAFEDDFDSQLAQLEERFSDFVTRNSFAGSMGR